MPKQLQSVTIGKYLVSYEIGMLYVSDDRGLVFKQPCHAEPQDVDQLIELASQACAYEARIYLNAYRTISGKDWAPLGELDHLRRRG